MRKNTKAQKPIPEKVRFSKIDFIKFTNEKKTKVAKRHILSRKKEDSAKSVHTNTQVNSPIPGKIAKCRGYYSVTVNGNWRVIYKFENQNAVLVDYLDYH